MRTARAIITVATGRKGTIQFPVQRVESYATSQAVDIDADSFSIDIGDVSNQLAACTERDNEIRVSLFLTDLSARSVQIFQGIADDAQYQEDFILSIEGRDEPSSIAVDSDALPGRWKHVVPKSFITARAHSLGISNVQIATMAVMNSLYTDGSEKEWAFWYRMARMRDMYMWSDNVGKLIIDKLGYSLAPTYNFGVPNQRGQRTQEFWIGVESHTLTSSKQNRIGKSLVYGEDAKKGKAFVAQGIDTSITAWRKRPVTVSTSTKAKTQAEAKKEADSNVFESIVGAQEIQLTIQDTAILIQQNRMAQVNLPEYGIEGIYFIVGVQRRGGTTSGLTQVVRLREKGFALPERVPTAPTLVKNPKGLPDAANKPITSIGAALAAQGIKYADSFVRATQEYGVAAGWNFSTFLGVLLAICASEGNFQNVREKSPDSTLNGIEWYPQPDGTNDNLVPTPRDPITGDPIFTRPSLAEQVTTWKKTFANSNGNPYNPFKGTRSNDEAGVGPMQLTDKSIKEFADKLGNATGNTTVDEYSGGRWFPDSNIRAAAKLLVDKLKVSPPADPTIDADIWIGVARYNGSALDGPYVRAVKSSFNSIYASDASSAVQAVKANVPGSGQRTLTWTTKSGHSTDITLPAEAPDEVAKVLTWANSMLGDPYQWGGAGPHYDCSSFVTKALSIGAPYLHALLAKPPGLPNPATNTHGQDTYTLVKLGKSVSSDNLLPGDLVFFEEQGANEPGHVGLYIGDGLYVHDPHPGDVVKVSGLAGEKSYMGARRLIVWPTKSPGTR